MEMKFNETACRCLRRAVSQQQARELTHEVRLPDAMPDIGRVLGCWGQPVVRGKEWRGSSMGVSGGVQAWALYLPEDGSEVQSMEVWIPWQMKWELPQTEKDGAIWVYPLMKNMDARTTSPRKMMLRCEVSAWAQALEDVQMAVCSPENAPVDVQLLKASYPMELPLEAGEKQLQIEEELTLPDTYPAVERLLRYELSLQTQEQKMMASRLVFRGKAMLHMLYMGDGKLYVWEQEIPFSQFADLEREYGPNAGAQITPVLTDLELEKLEDRLLLKAAAAAQYVICDRVMVELAEDAYSPVRDVKPQLQELKLPRRLEQTVTEMSVRQPIKADVGQIVDVCWMPDHPQYQQSGDVAELNLPGQFQMLYRDDTGALQWGAVRYDQQVQIPSDSGTALDGSILPEGLPQGMLQADGAELSAAFRLETAAYAREGQRMLCGLEMGEVRQPDPGRPSLILRRFDDSGLWTFAKNCGSTVEAIRKANGLETEPENGRMLLIPVI